MKNITKIITATLLLLCCHTGIVAQDHEEWYLYSKDGFNIYMNEFGSGDTVIVLHGGFGAEHSYLIEALAPLKSQFHFVLFDQRGSLRSAAPDSALSFEKLVDDIENIRISYKLNKIILMGHSMGTFVAMAYAEKYPARVKNLVLLSSYPPRSPVMSIRNMATYYLENRDAVATERRLVNFPANKNDWTDKMYTYHWRISFAGVNIYNVSRWAGIKGGVAFFNQKTANIIFPTAPVNWDYVQVFNKNYFPVSVINGNHDYLNFSAKSPGELLEFFSLKKNIGLDSAIRITGKTLQQLNSEKRWEDYEKVLPGLRVSIVENSGHRIWVDEPVKFKEILSQALKRKY